MTTGRVSDLGSEEWIFRSRTIDGHAGAGDEVYVRARDMGECSATGSRRQRGRAGGRAAESGSGRHMRGAGASLICQRPVRGRPGPRELAPSRKDLDPASRPVR